MKSYKIYLCNVLCTRRSQGIRYRYEKIMFLHETETRAAARHWITINTDFPEIKDRESYEYSGYLKAICVHKVVDGTEDSKLSLVRRWNSVWPPRPRKKLKPTTTQSENCTLVS